MTSTRRKLQGVLLSKFFLDYLISSEYHPQRHPITFNTFLLSSFSTVMACSSLEICIRHDHDTLQSSTTIQTIPAAWISSAIGFMAITLIYSYCNPDLPPPIAAPSQNLTTRISMTVFFVLGLATQWWLWSATNKQKVVESKNIVREKDEG